ncbi:hypothetical protein C8Q74DRAFT_1369190 [Fomes fomentarius]|nr:hypothetical protein C8Q74DRAFT_1369190 [Fomes fomentarius]
MDGYCRGSQCSAARRQRVFPRQTLSITPVATPTSDLTRTGTPAAQDTGNTSDALSRVTTSAPSSPTGRQDQDDPPSDQDSTSDDGSSSDTSKGSSLPPTSDPSGDATSQPTSQDSSKPPTSQPTSDPPTSKPTSKPTSDPPTSQPTTEPTSAPPTTDPSSLPPTSEPSSLPPTSDPNPDSTTSISTVPTSLPPTSSTSDLVSPTALPASNNTESFQTTITSAIATTVINGTTSTLFTTIPTTLSQDTTGDNAATKRNIIAGSVGGAAFIILIGALLLFYRRHQNKKLSFFKGSQPKPRTRLLDGEDLDDYDLGPPTRYRDYPASVVSSHAHSRSVTNGTPTPISGRSPTMRDFQASPGPSILGQPLDPHRAATPGALPPGAAAPHLLGMRAETGSIFREAVWPPPGAQLVDPIMNASNSVDLSSIVDDVMGPNAGAAAAAGASARPPPSAFRTGPGTANESSSSLVGDDPFASLSMLTISRPGSVTHLRETSEAPLLPRAASSTPGFFEARGRDTPEPPGSPMPPPSMGPLFVTNAGPLSPTSTISPGSPPKTFVVQQALGQTTSPTQSNPPQGQPRNWLERSPKKLSREMQRPSIDGQDVTEVSSTGHSVGQAM